ncbi:MAG: deoxyguanosinetriphosphate triphosphohydrolase [Pseudomonadota bacterium]
MISSLDISAGRKALTNDPGFRPLAFPGPLSPYASFAEKSRGRLHTEPESTSRTAFQRDRDRVIHASAFRRLKHKTQVFIYHEGDLYRTRLTHSLEAAQISRSLARTLQLDEDLAECIALAHDLGHPPFGHTGEDVLIELMADYGGFDHNAQTLRLLTKLERRHARFDGLNLAWETLEGVVKHSEWLIGADPQAYPAAIAEYVQVHDLRLDQYASLESQVAAISDDIAYNNHDIDDGLRAGLFSIDDARGLPLVGDALDRVSRLHPDASNEILIAEAVSDLIGEMITDVVEETRARISASGVQNVEDVRNAGRNLVAFSEGLNEKLLVLREYLKTHMYQHYKVNRARSQAKRVVADLFNQFFLEPDTLPPEWMKGCSNAGDKQRARVVCDYIAGMTDRYAMREHARLFSSAPLL